MGMLADLFVASRDEADSVDLLRGPGTDPTRRVFQAKGLDPFILSRLEMAITGLPSESVVSDLDGATSG